MTGAAVADGNEVRVILGFKGPARCPIVETTVAAVIPAYILCGTPVIRLQRDAVAADRVESTGRCAEPCENDPR
jgi:hypothetical protein